MGLFCCKKLFCKIFIICSVFVNNISLSQDVVIRGQATKSLIVAPGSSAKQKTDYGSKISRTLMYEADVNIKIESWITCNDEYEDPNETNKNKQCVNIDPGSFIKDECFSGNTAEYPNFISCPILSKSASFEGTKEQHDELAKLFGEGLRYLEVSLLEGCSASDFEVDGSGIVSPESKECSVRFKGRITMLSSSFAPSGIDSWYEKDFKVICESDVNIPDTCLQPDDVNLTSNKCIKLDDKSPKICATFKEKITLNPLTAEQEGELKKRFGDDWETSTTYTQSCPNDELDHANGTETQQDCTITYSGKNASGEEQSIDLEVSGFNELDFFALCKDSVDIGSTCLKSDNTNFTDGNCIKSETKEAQTCYVPKEELLFDLSEHQKLLDEKLGTAGSNPDKLTKTNVKCYDQETESFVLDKRPVFNYKTGECPHLMCEYDFVSDIERDISDVQIKREIVNWVSCKLGDVQCNKEGTIDQSLLDNGTCFKTSAKHTGIYKCYLASIQEIDTARLSEIKKIVKDEIEKSTENEFILSSGITYPDSDSFSIDTASNLLKGKVKIDYSLAKKAVIDSCLHVISPENDPIKNFLIKNNYYALEMKGNYEGNPLTFVYLNANPSEVSELPEDWKDGRLKKASIARINYSPKYDCIYGLSVNDDVSIGYGYDSTLIVYTQTPFNQETATIIAINDHKLNPEIVGDAAASTAISIDSRSDTKINLEFYDRRNGSQYVPSKKVHLVSYAKAQYVASAGVGGASVKQEIGDPFNVMNKNVLLGDGAYVDSEAVGYCNNANVVSAGIGSALYNCEKIDNVKYFADKFSLLLGSNNVVVSVAQTTPCSSDSGSSNNVLLSVGVGAAISKSSSGANVYAGFNSVYMKENCSVFSYASDASTGSTGIVKSVGVGVVTNKEAGDVTVSPGDINFGKNINIVAKCSGEGKLSCVGVGSNVDVVQIDKGSVTFSGNAKIIAISSGGVDAKAIAIGGERSDSLVVQFNTEGVSPYTNVVDLLAIANNKINPSIKINSGCRIELRGSKDHIEDAGIATTVNFYGGIYSKKPSSELHVVSSAVANLFGETTGIKELYVQNATVNLCNSGNIKEETFEFDGIEINAFEAGRREITKESIGIKNLIQSASLTIDPNGKYFLGENAQIVFNSGTKFSYAGNYDNVIKHASSEMWFSNIGDLSLASFNSTGNYYGAYKLIGNNQLQVDNNLVVYGDSKFIIGTGESLNNTLKRGGVIFDGDMAKFENKGTALDSINYEFNFRNNKKLDVADFCLDNSCRFQKMYSIIKPLTIDNTMVLMSDTMLSDKNDSTIFVTGGLVINGELSYINTNSVIGCSSGSTFNIKNFKGLMFSDFTTGKHKMLYSRSSNVLNVTNKLIFSGYTDFTFDIDILDISLGNLELADIAVLNFQASQDSLKTRDNQVIKHSNTSVYNIQKTVNDFKFSDFHNGQWNGLYETTADTLLLDNTLNLNSEGEKSGNLVLDYGKTLTIRSSGARFSSNRQRVRKYDKNLLRYIGETEGSIVVLENANAFSSDFYIYDGSRFKNLFYSNAQIENRLIVGSSSYNDVFTIDTINFKLFDTASLDINSGSTLRFMNNGTILADLGQVTHVKNTTFDFCGVANGLNVRSLSVSSRQGLFHNLYQNATQDILSIDNNVKLTSSTIGSSVFEIGNGTTLDVGNGYLDVGKGCTLLLDANSTIKNVNSSTFNKDKESIFEIKNDFYANRSYFSNGGNWSNLYAVIGNELIVNNVLKLGTNGGFELEKNEKLDLSDGGKLYLTEGSQLRFKKGNGGLENFANNNATKHNLSLCVFIGDHTSSIEDMFSSGKKYYNLYSYEEGPTGKTLHIDNKISVGSGEVFCVADGENLYIERGALHLGGGTFKFNSGSILTFCDGRNRQIYANDGGTIDIDSHSTTVLAGYRDAGISRFSIGNILYGLYEIKNTINDKKIITHTQLTIPNIFQLGNYHDVPTHFAINKNESILVNNFVMDPLTKLTIHNGSRFQLVNNTAKYKPNSTIEFETVALTNDDFLAAGRYQYLYSIDTDDTMLRQNSIQNNLILNSSSLILSNSKWTIESGGNIKLLPNSKLIFSGKAGSLDVLGTITKDVDSTISFQGVGGIDASSFASYGKYYELYRLYNFGSYLQETICLPAASICGYKEFFEYLGKSYPCSLCIEDITCPMGAFGRYRKCTIREEKMPIKTLSIDNIFRIGSGSRFNFNIDSNLNIDEGLLVVESGGSLVFDKDSCFNNLFNKISLDTNSECHFKNIDFGEEIASRFKTAKTECLWGKFNGLYKAADGDRSLIITNKIFIEGGKIHLAVNNKLTFKGSGARLMTRGSGSATYVPNYKETSSWRTDGDDSRYKQGSSTIILEDVGEIAIDDISFYKDNLDEIPKCNVANDNGQAAEFKRSRNFNSQGDGWFLNVLEVASGSTLLIDKKIGSVRARALGNVYANKKAKMYCRICVVFRKGMVILQDMGTLRFKGPSAGLYTYIIDDGQNLCAGGYAEGWPYHREKEQLMKNRIYAGSVIELDNVGLISPLDFRDENSRRFPDLYESTDNKMVVSNTLRLRNSDSTIDRTSFDIAATSNPPEVPGTFLPSTFDKVPNISFWIARYGRVELGGDQGKDNIGATINFLDLNQNFKIIYYNPTGGTWLYSNPIVEACCKGVINDAAVKACCKETIGNPAAETCCKEIIGNAVVFDNIGGPISLASFKPATFVKNDKGEYLCHANKKCESDDKDTCYSEDICEIKEAGGRFDSMFKYSTQETDFALIKDLPKIDINNIDFRLFGTTFNIESGAHIKFVGRGAGIRCWNNSNIIFDSTKDAIIEIYGRGEFALLESGSFIFDKCNKADKTGGALQGIFSNNGSTLKIDKVLKLSGTSKWLIGKDNDGSKNVAISSEGSLYFEKQSAGLDCYRNKNTKTPIYLDSNSRTIFAIARNIYIKDFKYEGKYAGLFSCNDKTCYDNEDEKTLTLRNNVQLWSGTDGSWLRGSNLNVKLDEELVIPAGATLDIARASELDVNGTLNVKGGIINVYTKGKFYCNGKVNITNGGKINFYKDSTFIKTTACSFGQNIIKDEYNYGPGEMIGGYGNAREDYSESISNGSGGENEYEVKDLAKIDCVQLANKFSVDVFIDNLFAKFVSDKSCTGLYCNYIKGFGKTTFDSNTTKSKLNSIIVGVKNIKMFDTDNSINFGGAVCVSKTESAIEENIVADSNLNVRNLSIIGCLSYDVCDKHNRNFNINAMFGYADLNNKLNIAYDAKTGNSVDYLSLKFDNKAFFSCCSFSKDLYAKNKFSIAPILSMNAYRFNQDAMNYSDGKIDFACDKVHRNIIETNALLRLTKDIECGTGNKNNLSLLCEVGVNYKLHDNISNANVRLDAIIENANIEKSSNAKFICQFGVNYALSNNVHVSINYIAKLNKATKDHVVSFGTKYLF